MTSAERAVSDYRVLIMLDTIEVGGPGKGILQFCRFAPKQAKIVVSNFAYPGAREPLFNRAAIETGVNLIELVQKSKFDTKPVKELADQVIEENIQIVQSHSFKAHMAARFISHKCKIPWLAFAHGWTQQNRRVRLYNFVERRLLRQADAVCVVSETLRKEFSQIRPDSPPEILTNAVERMEDPPLRERPEHDPLLLCIGRLSHEKGQDMLIEALASVIDRSWRLVFLGEGPDREQLERRCVALGLADRVSFAGYQSDLSRYFDEASLLVVPSRSEGIPNVILESFAHAIPVIACKVGGVPEIVTDGETGWLCDAAVNGLSAGVTLALDQADHWGQIGMRGWASLYPKFGPAERAGRMSIMHRKLIESAGATVTNPHNAADKAES